MKSLLTLFLVLTAHCGFTQNLLINPSFEGTPQAHILPLPWHNCFDGASPDAQPGIWDIYKPASEGNTYASFVASGLDGSYMEGAGQDLTTCLMAGVTYTLTVDLAFSPIYHTAEPGDCYGSFSIWGGNGACDKNEMLWGVGPITDTTWQSYTATFTPTQDWCNISFGPTVITPCNGYINILVDNIRDFSPVDANQLTTISGAIYYDVDTNCTYSNQTDYPIPYKVVSLQPANYYAITNANGNYTVNIPANSSGTQNLNTTANIVPFDVLCPADTNGHQLTLNGVSENLSGYDFALTSEDGPCRLLNVSTMHTPYRAAFNASRWTTITNHGPEPFINGSIAITYTDTLVRPVSNGLNLPYPSQLNGNVLTINLPQLFYGQSVSFGYTEDVNDYALGDGTELTTINLALLPSNNCNTSYGYSDMYIEESLIVGPYDPNDKQANPAGQGLANAILRSDDIEYTIRFQNLGTDTAFTVKVIDTLSTRFDITTLTIGAASHAFNIELVNPNILVYTFNNIQLPPASVNELGSIGMFKYKIAQKPNNPPTYQIHNTAHIYFDLMPAVVTNTYTHTVVEALSVNEQPTTIDAALYPNPTSGTFTLALDAFKPGQSYSVAIFTATGALVKEMKDIKTAQQQVDVANLSNGFYYYRLLTSDGKTAAGRFVKE